MPGFLDVKAAKQTLQALKKEQNIYSILNSYDCRRVDDAEMLKSLKSNFNNVYVVKQRAVYRRTLTNSKAVFSDDVKSYGGLTQAQNEIGYICNKIFSV